MNLKPESLATTTYLPVAWEFREVIEEQISKKTNGKINFFCSEEGICDAVGTIIEMKEVKGQGVFIFLDNGSRIRIDRIITLFGKPGAAYDEYDAYGLACLDCTGGYDKAELKGYSI